MRWRIDGFSWSPPGKQRALDGSLRIWFAERTTRYQHALWMHLRYERAADDVFHCPLSRVQIEQLAQRLLGEYTAGYRRSAQDIDSLGDARWELPNPPPDTAASRYGHPARARLDRDLSLGSAEGMQDWPCEVARGEHLDRYLDYYDDAEDDEIRHDAMWLALYAAKSWLQPAPRWDWFSSRIRSRFVLHAHAVFALGAYPKDGFGGRLHALGLDCLQSIRLTMDSVRDR